ncbi:MAG: sigma-70 family RNA polymerase sigma factor [Vicinamibacterales bacterium]
MPDHDERLAIRCLLGEAAAFDELIARWHPGVVRYARRMTGTDDAADDVAQDVWLRVVRGLPRLDDPARIRPWIFGIARRVLMDRLRARYATPAMADVELDAIEMASSEEDDLQARLVEMELALASLPVIERDVLALFYLDELSLIEVAAVVGVPVGTVKSRLFRARQLLRTAMSHTSQDER